MEKKTKTTSSKLSVGKVLGSPYTIIVVLILFAVGLLVYTRYLLRCNTVYTFAGYTEEFSFFGGTVYEGPIVNHFGDSKVLYTGSDINLYDYEIGYYVKYEDEYSPVSIMRGYDTTDDDDKEKKAASLKEILNGSSFSFTEMHKDAVFISEKNVQNLKNLVFKVSGKDKDGEEIFIEVPMVIEKITK